ncbi:MAG TPA: glycosyltransferase family 39 protein [Bacilli bacterium]
MNLIRSNKLMRLNKLIGQNKWLIAIVIFGSALRLLWIYMVDTQPIFDFKHYHDLAMSLLTVGDYAMPEGLDYIKQSTAYIQTGVHYPTAFRPPGYPFFLVLLYAVYPSILAAKIANVGLCAVWMLCIYWLGKRFLGHRVGLGAAFLTAVFPPAVYYCSVVGTEIISVTLLLIVLCLQLSHFGGRWGNPLLLGSLLGFLALVKPYFAVFPVIYLVIAWWLSREGKGVNHPAAPGMKTMGLLKDFLRDLLRWLKPAAVSLLCLAGMMAVVISPWTLRNYVAFERFVPISTNGSFVLYQNNHDLNEGRTMDVMLVPNSIFKTDRILNAEGVYNEPDAMKLAKKEAMQWIASHKGEYLLLGLKRLGQSYFTIGIESWGWSMATAKLRFNEKYADPLILGARASGLVVGGGGLIYAILVMYFYLRRRPLKVLHKINLLFIVFFTLIIFATEGQPRYMFPLYPFFILGICWMVDRLAAGLGKEGPVDSLDITTDGDKLGIAAEK